MEWRRVSEVDYSPKGRREFVDYESGPFRILNYVDEFHLFRKKVFLGRYRTLQEAKRTAHQAYTNKFPRIKKGTCWSF